MFRDDYQREMDDVRLSEQQKEWLTERMAAQPVKAARRAGRTLLVAAAVCALCAASALALSPTLREQMEAFLGGFSGYTQPVEAQTQVRDGLEFQVLSAMADSSITKVYVQVRDLEGDRLSGEVEVMGLIERRDAPEAPKAEGNSYTFGGQCVGYEAETKTALLEFSRWGGYPTDAGEMCLNLIHLGGQQGEVLLEESLAFPLETELIDRRTIPLSGTVNRGIALEQVQFSALGVTLHTRGEGNPSRDLSGVFLKDGTVLHPRYAGQGGDGDTRTSCWEFADPVDPEEVVGLSLQCWYIPIQADDTAGPGHWLEQLPE